ncbi:deoxyribonuclease IV [Paenibacillus sp. J2TS4]|uniref:deoxyribonuclease IV n=1 Tax=Paenibacillus sp. J2TS4 TaxID=2807194 RepID=UPI001B1606B5|nr:deoxyribonuclease IV [Paenibacillus sp. J2TS4]GIP32654.1 putative endonuclease 4 [Paenibacillus sp. J2TS4]
MRLGSHISIRRGYLQAARTATAIGASCFQYFPKNPRGLSLKSFDAADGAACAQYCREQDLISVGHSPYPANLALEPSPLREAVIASLINDLEIAECCGSAGIVVHFGKFKSKDPLQGYRFIIDTLNAVLKDWTGKAKLLIENQAGEGAAMGTTLEELVQIRKLADHPDKIGFCLDTCHAFASGLWNGRNWPELVERGGELGYFDQLQVVHLNDSVYPSGSRKDRHANFGQGKIGEDHLLEFLLSPPIRTVPVILETAAGSDHTHREEIKYIIEAVQRAL